MSIVIQSKGRAFLDIKEKEKEKKNGKVNTEKKKKRLEFCTSLRLRSDRGKHRQPDFWNAARIRGRA